MVVAWLITRGWGRLGCNFEADDRPRCGLGGADHFDWGGLQHGVANLHIQANVVGTAGNDCGRDQVGVDSANGALDLQLLADRVELGLIGVPTQLLRVVHPVAAHRLDEERIGRHLGSDLHLLFDRVQGVGGTGKQHGQREGKQHTFHDQISLRESLAEGRLPDQ
ncbi:hypothetical protein D9M73_224850 [compost metagenome]